MKRRLIRLGIAILSLCGAAIIAYSADDYWSHYRLFRDNFAMSWLSIHRLKGYEWSWMDYTAWISFISDGPPVLKHPENYRDVPCRFESIPNENPFFDNSYWVREKDEQARFKRYLEYRKQIETTVPAFQCKEGRTDFWTTSYGYKGSDPSWLIYRPSDGQVLFRVGHLN
jgi:hypothetical protein